jgi:hypothetical protein
MTKTSFALVLLSFFSLQTRADWRDLQAGPVDRAFQEALRSMADEAKKEPSFQSWVAHFPFFSHIERELLAKETNLPKTVPDLNLEFSGKTTVMKSGSFTLEILNAETGEAKLNGQALQLSREESIQKLSEKMMQLTKKTSSLRWWLFETVAGLFCTAAEARGSGQSAHIEGACLGRTERFFNSIYPASNSLLGYAPAIYLSALAISGMRRAYAYGALSSCEKQIQELKSLLKEVKLGIKSIDCGSDESGSDASIEFWVPEKNPKNKKEFKSTTFNLDYSRSLAQEIIEDDEDDDAPKKKKRKPVTRDVFMFGRDNLQEVRSLYETPEGKFDCKAKKEGEPGFDVIQKKVEPFRRVFHYLGSNETCLKCEKEVERELRLPRAPSYFNGGAAPGGSGKSKGSTR